jgi:hypothetical protein
VEGNGREKGFDDGVHGYIDILHSIEYVDDLFKGFWICIEHWNRPG